MEDNIYIIRYAIISTGDVIYGNPSYSSEIVYNIEHLAKAIDNIKKLGWQVDIQLYKAKRIDFKLNYTDQPKQIIEKIPDITLEDK